VLVVLGLAGAAFAYTRWRIRKLNVMNALLEERVQERTQALDASEQRAWEAYARLQVLDEQKNQFLGIVAHDLRNPLNGIVLAAQLLEGEKDHTRVDAITKKIAKQGLDMSDLIGRFLDKAVLEAGQVSPHLESISLETVAREIIDLHQFRAREKDILLSFDPGEATSLVQADQTFTMAILDNLVSNALKFSPPGTQVWVRLRLKEACLRVSVEDQGPGLTLEDQERLFGRFAKLSAEPTGGETSTGLGLSIVKHMAEAMACQVSVDTQPGQGATFHVDFPLLRSVTSAAE
jgi:signal transduction histidine kinase